MRQGGAFHRLTDPWRRPLRGIRSLFSPIGSLLDKVRVARLRSRVLKDSLEGLVAEPETTTLEALQRAGFSASMIERFFRPFLGGIFLDKDLQTSSRMFNFVFRMFSSGQACLPSAGMEAIPRQIASGLPPDSIRLNARVVRVQEGSTSLESGELIRARTVMAGRPCMSESPSGRTLNPRPLAIAES